MFYNKSEKIQAAVVKIMQEAYQRLLDDGVSKKVADSIVKKNFQRVNADSRLILTVDELCKY